jgi:uncharacterized cofD-like protein
VSFFKWLYPGMRVKRWLALLFAGIVLISLGAAYFLKSLYSEGFVFPGVVGYLTLQFLPRIVRALLFALIGVPLLVYAVVQLNRSLLSAFVTEGDKVVDQIYHRRHLSRGPKVVAIGGGTGLSNLLRGLKEYTGNLTAVVTVADDGGSSGRLRDQMGVLPPGDFRQCLVALSDVEPVMTKLFQYRFPADSGLDGHSFGNLFIVAMMGVTGDFLHAMRESSRVLATRGQILPSTLANVTLCAEMDDGHVVKGESHIAHDGKTIKRVFLSPEHVPAYPAAVRAIEDADLVILGPGSLYTSVLPNLLVDGIREAVAKTTATVVYVCNVATEPGETDHYNVGQHVTAIERYLGPATIDLVLANEHRAHDLSPQALAMSVSVNGTTRDTVGPRLMKADVIDQLNPRHHDSTRVAESLMQLYYDRGTDT